MDEKYTCVIGKKGFHTFTCNNKFIYSRYDPYKEASSFLTRFRPLRKVVITFCGADYINSRILEEDSGDTIILSFEPVNFEKLSTSPRLLRFKTLGTLENYILQNSIGAVDVSLLHWQPFIESNPGKFLPQLKAITALIKKSTLSSKTAEKMDYLESRNFILNLNSLQKVTLLSPNIQKSKNPVLILSSGYSIKDNLDYIKQAANYSIIFALPSSVPYLISQNIRPDYIIAVDPGYGTYYHLLQYAQNNFSIITTLNSTPSVFRLSNFNFFLFNYNTLLEKKLFHKENIITSSAEGSVFFNLLSILNHMGFSEAILIGQDFGYKKYRSHIDGGTFENIFLGRSSFFNPLETLVKGLETAKNPDTIKLGDKTIKTDITLKVYYEHFLGKSFPVKLYLPDNPFNPLDNKLDILPIKELKSVYPSIENRSITGFTKNIEEVKDRFYSENKILLHKLFNKRPMLKKLKLQDNL